MECGEKSDKGQQEMADCLPQVSLNTGVCIQNMMKLHDSNVLLFTEPLSN
jgi:hypothetical protein